MSNQRYDRTTSAFRLTRIWSKNGIVQPNVAEKVYREEDCEQSCETNIKVKKFRNSQRTCQIAVRINFSLEYSNLCIPLCSSPFPNNNCNYINSKPVISWGSRGANSNENAGDRRELQSELRIAGNKWR